MMHPKFLNELKYKSKVEDIERRRSWGMLLGFTITKMGCNLLA
jgi:hypothetical protein